MKLKREYVIVFFVIMTLSDCFSQDKVIFEFMSGLPYNVPLPLFISQSNQRSIRLTAEYNSEPFKIPIFWIWRIGYSDNKSMWELEAVHHKLFLKNKPPEVAEYSVSHGLNIIVINRGFIFDRFVLRTGAGIILAHPENTVRGKQLSENKGILNGGYYFTGPAFLASVSGNYDLFGGFHSLIELKLAAGFAEIPVEDGSSKLLFLSLIFSFGLGYGFVL